MKPSLHRIFHKESFVRYVVTLMMGTAASGVLNALIIPILSRSYTPEHFGILSMFTAIVSIMAIWAAWRYELAIVLPEKQEDAISLMKLSLGIVLLMSVICLFLALAFGTRLTHLFGISYFNFWLLFLPLSICCAGIFNVLFYWCSRNKRFNKIAVGKVVQTAVTLVSQIMAFITFQAGAGGLICGYMLGQISGAGFLFTQTRGTHLWKNPALKMRSMAKRYSDFPKLASLGAFFDTAAVQLPLLVIPALFTPHIGGIYAITDRLMRIPAGFIGSSVGQVFYQRLAHFKDNPPERKRLIFSTWKYLFLSGLGPLLLVVLFGPAIFPFFLGPKWQEAGHFAQILALGFLFQFVASSTSLGIVALERLDLLFLWQILNFVSMAGVFLLSFLFFRNDIISFLWMWSCKEGIIYLLYMLALLQSHRVREQRTGGGLKNGPLPVEVEIHP